MYQQCFNLRREANPLATHLNPHESVVRASVSISGEKPIPWRPSPSLAPGSYWLGFNLRREANPLATSKGLSVSGVCHLSFNLRREANPLATYVVVYMIQMKIGVSISGEKPIPWRQPPEYAQRGCARSFNLRREANPLATSTPVSFAARQFPFQSQARSQSPGDAEQHAAFTTYLKFQSQARSQSPGDHNAYEKYCKLFYVSISGEKPIPWRPILDMIP